MKYKKHTTSGHLLIILITAIIVSSINSTAQSHSYIYAVVCSEAAYSDNGWRTVADSLVKKHAVKGVSRLFKWQSQVGEVKTALGEFNPDYVAFVAKPATECNTSFVVAVHRLCRALDSDPYGDAIWGIVTGYKAEDALRAVSESLSIKTVLAASGNLSYEPPIQRFYQAVGMTCDSYTKTDYLFSGSRGSVYTENKRPDNEQDRIKIVSKWLSSESMNISIQGKGTIGGAVDCIITGGHGNVNLWQCHYPEAGSEGYMQSSGGKLYGAPYSGSAIEINAKTPKVYWCASNCLMGNPDSKDNIVYGAFGSGRAVQMFGFIINASAGDEFMAWGVYDRVTKRAGTLTLPQGYFLSNNNALFEIRNPGNLINTRLIQPFMDSTVFYGDPAAEVHFHSFGDSAHAFKTDIIMSNSTNGLTEFTYTYTMLAHDLEYGEGYCYQFRPASMLPVRIDPSTVTIVENEGHKCEITDNILIWEMLSKGEKLNKGLSKTLTWRAKVTDTKTTAGKNIQIAEKPAAQTEIRHIRNGMTNSILLSGLSDGTYSLSVTDLTGKVCCIKPFSPSGDGTALVSIEKSLPSGIYCGKVKGTSGDGSILFLQ
ncbi:MAG TPA: hypothetical protein VHO70_23255 [Chitinispirillaceae bacterium]|nr:hypothetical protein [Chitinispirillaceae bacterium]